MNEILIESEQCNIVNDGTRCNIKMIVIQIRNSHSTINQSTSKWTDYTICVRYQDALDVEMKQNLDTLL